jgi:hypothetical protein
MRGNNMGYFWGLVKKEFIEIRYSYKQLILYAGIYGLGIYVINSFLNSINQINSIVPINWNNAGYFIVVFLSSFAAGNFLIESILSDKNNQTFERYFVSGNIKTIMLAKLSTMSILGILPFFIFYAFFLINGANIIDTVFTAINTPFYFWIALCVVTILTFPFSDERSASFACMPCLLVIVGIFIANDYIAAHYHPVLSCIFTIACAVIATIIAYKVYKNTKYFLKI